jgi:two-component system phosphate regulon response regulator PhoB
VEDHAATLDLWASALRVVGYDVCPAASVAEAKFFLENTSVDLVITDWSLGGGTGSEVCQAARELKPSPPIIVISGVTGDEVANIMNSMPDAYFTKPVKVRMMVETIERLLNNNKNRL